MTKTLRHLFSIPLLFLLAAGCESYINDVEPLKDYAPDDKLNTEDNIDFLATGVLSKFADVSSQVSCLSDLLSDQLIFTNQMPLATYPTYNEIDLGQILLDNTNVDGVFQDVCRYRKAADDLVRRAGVIVFSDTTKREYAWFIGYFHGGLARYYMATTFAVNPATPGGVIDAGPFIPQTNLLDDAIARMKNALLHQEDPVQKRIVNSMLAKAYLAKQDYANAATYAAAGMQSGDEAFVCLYNNVSNNYYWSAAGLGRQQMGVHPRFLAYLAADPAEAERIPLDSVRGRDLAWYPFQMKYAEPGGSFHVMTWQENDLMTAECALRGAGGGSPVTLVNDVRTSHGLSTIASVDLAGLMVERDKELFCQGVRLVDQDRGAVAWHLAAGLWKYLPIPRRERDSNPNLPPF